MIKVARDGRGLGFERDPTERDPTERVKQVPLQAGAQMTGARQRVEPIVLSRGER
jgi:hypothetical protein